jgi:uncharacterized membrane protein
VAIGPNRTGASLRGEKNRGIKIGLVILGLVFVVAGCLTTKGDPFQIMGLTIDQSEVRGLVLLGLVAIVVGIAVPRAFNEYMPDSISFDNGLGLVEVRKRKRRFLMPYQPSASTILFFLIVNIPGSMLPRLAFLKGCFESSP